MWKQKAIDRRLENKELGKRKKELNKSREQWKMKYLKELHSGLSHFKTGNLCNVEEPRFFMLKNKTPQDLRQVRF